MRISFQGERGAYSEEAIIKHYGSTASPIPKPYLKEVFDSVENGVADLGLVPVENTLEGSIVRTYDLLLERSLKVVDEVILRVNHCLIVNKGVSSYDVKKVYSHPQALGQCRFYLEEHGYEPIAAYDTAGSVKMLKEEGIRDAAAIASRMAAEVYDMVVLDQGIETHKENFTRFMAIGNEEHPPTGDYKTSIAFILEHRPGTLFKSLRAFADRGINLTKIESRPQLGKPWEYIFFLDFEGHKEDPNMSDALIVLKENSRFLKVLGSYPRANK